MVRTSCHCGAVLIDVATAPTELNACQCSICHSYGALWAYYRPDQVRFGGEGGTDTYVWNERSLAFQRCRTCGCLVFWRSVDPFGHKIGVNARMMARDVIAAARIYEGDA